MFVEELKLLFFPLLEEINILFSRVFNKGVSISNEMTIFILAIFIALLFIFIFSMWLLLSRRSQNEKGFEQPSPKIKKKNLQQLKKKRDKELDLRKKKKPLCLKKHNNVRKMYKIKLHLWKNRNKVCRFYSGI